MQARARLRGSSVIPAWARLDRAAVTLAGLSGRLSGPAESAVLEAAVAERTLRDLGERTAAVERALRLAPDEPGLKEAHDELLGHFTEGVAAYESLAAAAAGYVAMDGRATADTTSVSRLTEATDLLIASGPTASTNSPPANSGRPAERLRAARRGRREFARCEVFSEPPRRRLLRSVLMPSVLIRGGLIRGGLVPSGWFRKPPRR